jgi:hypothetical protein
VWVGNFVQQRQDQLGKIRTWHSYHRFLAFS